jgi:purine-binding chemotaxis protein CheW
MSGRLNLHGKVSRPVTLESTEAMKQYLTFRLGNETFAIEVAFVKEVIPYEGLTEIPLVPDVIRGVINLRGAVVPVVDPQVRFGRPRMVPDRRSCIIVLDAPSGEEGLELGLLVDAVSAVLDLPLDAIEPPPRMGASIRSDFIAGVGKVEGGFLILLDASRVLSPEELNAMDAALPEP